MALKQESSIPGFDSPVRRLHRRATWLAWTLGGTLLYGTVGYRWLSGGQSSWVDCLYMTVITITTIGFGEVVTGADPAATRLFTLSLAVWGVGIFTYVLSNMTFFVTDPELRAYWRKRRMERLLKEWSGHYVVGGWGAMAARVADELRATQRPFVVVAPGECKCTPAPGPDVVWIEGDPGDEDPLRMAAIERAAGFFAASEDDAANMVACLAARQLGPTLRIVASVRDPRNADKMRRAGADAVVSAAAIGALRMASEMIRPMVVSFLDTMLRAKDPVLRVEEIQVSARAAGTPWSRWAAEATDAVLLAVRREGQWRFNPPADQPLVAGDVLVAMVTPDAHRRLLQLLG